MKKLICEILLVMAIISCQKPQYETVVVWRVSYWTIHNVAHPGDYNGPWECPAPDSIGLHTDIYNNANVDWAAWQTYQETPDVFLRDTTNHIVRYMRRDDIISKTVKEIP